MQVCKSWVVLRARGRSLKRPAAAVLRLASTQRISQPLSLSLRPPCLRNPRKRVPALAVTKFTPWESNGWRRMGRRSERASSTQRMAVEARGAMVIMRTARRRGAGSGGPSTPVLQKPQRQPERSAWGIFYATDCNLSRYASTIAGHDF